MINFVIVNCEGFFIEHQWDTKEEFLKVMKSDDIDIPMLDDWVNTLTTDDIDWTEEECKDNGIYNVQDIIDWIKNDMLINNV